MSNLILSNYGLRAVDHQRRLAPEARTVSPRVLRELERLRRELRLPCRDDALHRELVRGGLAETAAVDVPAEAIALRYRRNPLENVRRVVFEYTNVCDFDCLHCRNGHRAPVSETNPAALCAAVDRFVAMGVSSFHFIGGEVTRYGRGWLDVVEHIAAHEGATSGVLTNGWFLEQQGFRAAGETYADDRAYLEALRRRGLTHLLFSLDGPEALHDQWRRTPGLYRRIARAFDRVRNAGLHPAVSIVISALARERPEPFARWLEEVTDLVQPDGRSRTMREKIGALLSDESCHVSNLIDVGNAVGLAPHRLSLDEIPPGALRCKGFFRLCPNLRVDARGDLSPCPLIDGGLDFGNVHERGLLPSLNGMQTTFSHRLHAENLVDAYLPLLDRTIFGDTFGHLCAVRTLVTMLASVIVKGGIDPKDRAAIRTANEDVARRAGWLPPRGPRATGRRFTRAAS